MKPLWPACRPRPPSRATIRRSEGGAGNGEHDPRGHSRILAITPPTTGSGQGIVDPRAQEQSGRRRSLDAVDVPQFPGQRAFEPKIQAAGADVVPNPARTFVGYPKAKTLHETSSGHADLNRWWRSIDFRVECTFRKPSTYRSSAFCSFPNRGWC